MKLALASAPFFLAPLCLAQATIRVPGDAATIQAGIDLAQPGDTVLVAPGTYLEILDFLGKAITVESEDGAATTIVHATPDTLPCVSFRHGEGRGSVLRGFTVRGSRNTDSSRRGGGISCLDTCLGLMGSPTISACIIADNRIATYSPGGGVYGDALLEDCTIRANDAGFLSDGGGVFGDAVVLRCTVAENFAYDGGGIFLTGSGGLIEDSIVAFNRAQEGARGGGIHVAGGAAVIRRTLVARNEADGFFYKVTGAGVHCGAPGPTRLERCTVAGNRVFNPDPFSFSIGGVFGSAVLVDCIVGGNDADELGPPVSARYSDIEGNYPGISNLALDPLFVAPASLDYRLRAGSPCIDAGDPASALDPDCTRADMGAFSFAQANAFLRNGTGSNRVCFTSLSQPLLGGTWTVRLAAAGHAGATLSGLVGFGAPLAPGVQLPAGELLVDPSSAKLIRRLVVSNGAADDIALAIPMDPTLAGLAGYLQGFVLGGGTELCNALDVKLGN